VVVLFWMIDFVKHSVLEILPSLLPRLAAGGERGPKGRCFFDREGRQEGFDWPLCADRADSRCPFHGANKMRRLQHLLRMMIGFWSGGGRREEGHTWLEAPSMSDSFAGAGTAAPDVCMYSTVEYCTVCVYLTWRWMHVA
jgi:hypothetical protein